MSVVTTKIDLMPNSQQIGANIENLLKDFLSSLSFVLEDPVRIFPDDLSLMNSGSQHGLDLRWEIRFNQGGIRYTWFFESKGVGESDYLRTPPGGNKPFHIRLISDKLLQILSYSTLDYAGRGIDCWCLFAPYLKIDNADRNELDRIQAYLPLRLVIWDKDFLFSKLKHINPSLFQTIYTNDTNSETRSVDVSRSLINVIREYSVSRKFWNNIHRKYTSIRNDIVNRCKKELIFQSEILPPAQTPTASGHSPQRVTFYYFEFNGKKYYVEANILQQAIATPAEYSVVSPSPSPAMDEEEIGEISSDTVPSEESNLDSVRNVFVNSICRDTGRSLHTEFADLLNDVNNPFLHIQIKHKIPTFVEKIFFELIHDGSYFGCDDKPVYFESIKDFI